MLFTRGRLAGRFFFGGVQKRPYLASFSDYNLHFCSVFFKPPNLPFSPLESIDLTKLHLGTYILKETRVYDPCNKYDDVAVVSQLAKVPCLLEFLTRCQCKNSANPHVDKEKWGENYHGHVGAKCHRLGAKN